MGKSISPISLISTADILKTYASIGNRQRELKLRYKTLFIIIIIHSILEFNEDTAQVPLTQSNI